MEIKTIKKNVLLSKKTDAKLSLAYAAVLRKIEGLTIGVVKKTDLTEDEIILSAAQKELKEQLASKSENAKYSIETIELCESLIKELDKTMSENETLMAIKNAMVELELETLTSKDIGKVMGMLSKEYGKNINKSLANKLINENFVF